MTKYIGRRVDVGLARETTRGTAVATQHWMPKIGLAFFDRVSKETSQLNYGSIGEAAQAYKKQEWSEGSIESELNDRAFGLILYAAFGTLSTAGPTDSAYTHTFSLQNDSQHDSLTITIADPDRTDQFALCMLDSLDVSIAPGEIVKFVAAFKGRTGKQVAAASPTYATAFNKFLGRHAVVKIASAVGGLNAASALSLKAFNLRINKNLMLNSVLGTIWPEDVLNQKFEITGDFTLDLDDQTYRNLMLNNTYNALRLDITHADTLIGTSSRPRFKIDLARCHFEEWEPTRDNDALVTQKISFRALWDPTEQVVVDDCILVNNVSSY